jgi:hypothetical protein
MRIDSKHTKAQILHSMNIHDPKQSTHLVASNGLGTSAVSLLCNRKLDTLALGQRDPWLLRSDDENVALTGSERVVYGILDVNDVEASIVTLTVSDDTNTTHVTTTSNHGNYTSIELDVFGNLAGGKVDLHSVVDLDGWVRVADARSKISSAFLKEGYQPLI